ncbi:MAG TPA: flagellar basal body rod protein FlgB [Syntrophales bacterium]|nr:flagellar basal body rod protein FlgB [Syntrophales bacterium]
MQFLFDKAVGYLSTMMDFRAERHKVLVSNIVNLDTPDYKPKELVFNKSLEEAQAARKELELRRTNNGHLAAAPGNGEQFQVMQSGDKVEIDREMAALTENNLMFNLTVELLTRKFRGLNTVLKETR